MSETPWQAAEKIAESHLQALGFFRIRRTGAGADRGIDVVGQGIAAQVKLLRAAVGSPDIQRLRGAAHRFEEAAFYAHTSSGYSRSALSVAEEVDVSLFVYDLDGSVEAVNARAEELESPLTSVRRAFDQSNVARARMKAVKSVVDRVAADVTPRLQFLMEQLTAAIETVPEGTAFDDLPPEVKELAQESDELRALHQGRIPDSAFDQVGHALQRLVELTQKLDREDISELIHSAWRTDVTTCIGELHDQVDILTTEVIAWLGPSAVADLQDRAASIADDLDLDLTRAQVLEGWPTLPELGPVHSA